jgi:hypothetical protein
VSADAGSAFQQDPASHRGKVNLDFDFPSKLVKHQCGLQPQPQCRVARGAGKAPVVVSAAAKPGAHSASMVAGAVDAGPGTILENIVAAVAFEVAF